MKKVELIERTAESTHLALMLNQFNSVEEYKFVSEDKIIQLRDLLYELTVEAGLPILDFMDKHERDLNNQ